ncbi:MAG: hypothetical protein Q9184_007936 [Pyrenodesmia sp. 2 TL-2023]
MKGIHKEMVKGKQPTHFIRRARIAQGALDMKELDETAKQRESDKVEKAWRVVRDILQEQRSVKTKGLRSNFRFQQQKRRLVREGKFESVGNVAVALEEWRREKRLKGLR